MSKRTKRWLSIVTTLAVAFVMTFGCMGEVFAVENQTDVEQPAAVEQTEPAAPAEEAAPAEPAEQEEAAEGDVEVLGESTAEPVDMTIGCDGAETLKMGDGAVTQTWVVDPFNNAEEVKIDISVPGASGTEDAFLNANSGKVTLKSFTTVDKKLEVEENSNTINPVLSYAEGVMTVTMPENTKNGAYYLNISKGFKNNNEADPAELSKDNNFIIFFGPDLVVTHNDKSQQFWLEEGTNGSENRLYYYSGNEKKYVANEPAANYSAIKNTGNNEPVERAYGPSILNLLEAANINYSNFGEGQMVMMNSNDNHPTSLNWQRLFGQERYYFPGASIRISTESEITDQGAAVRDSEWDGMEEVSAIINLSDLSTTQFIFGQIAPSERNKPSFNKNMGTAGVMFKVNKKGKLSGGAQSATIEIKDTPAAKAEKPIVAKETDTGFKLVQDGDDLVVGDKLHICIKGEDGNPAMDGTKLEVSESPVYYYTTDATRPDMSSAICNYNGYEGIDKPYVVQKTGTLILKTRAFAEDCMPSDVTTYHFNVEPEEVNIKDTTVTFAAKTYAAGTRPAPVVKLNGAVLDKSIYRVAYNNYNKVGTAKVSVIGRGHATGVKTATYKVIPAKAKITKLTRGSKKLTVYYANQKATGVTKYQIAYKRSGYGWKNTTTTSTSKTIKGLKKGKKYYVKVRAYGSTGYGAWSDTKSIKVK